MGAALNYQSAENMRQKPISKSGSRKEVKVMKNGILVQECGRSTPSLVDQDKSAADAVSSNGKSVNAAISVGGGTTVGGKSK